MTSRSSLKDDSVQGGERVWPFGCVFQAARKDRSASDLHLKMTRFKSYGEVGGHFPL